MPLGGGHRKCSLKCIILFRFSFSVFLFVSFIVFVKCALMLAIAVQVLLTQICQLFRSAGGDW